MTWRGVAVCRVPAQKRETQDALVAQLKSKLQWETEARNRAEDQIRQYKEEVRHASPLFAPSRSLRVELRLCPIVSVCGTICSCFA